MIAHGRGSTQASGTSESDRRDSAEDMPPPPQPVSATSATAGPAAVPAHDASAARVEPVVEIELKLAAPEGEIPRLARLPLIRNSVIGRAVTRKMHSVYYDTPEHDLQGSGIALRLRREGGRWVQTLKSGGGVEAGLHSRNELESRLPAQLLDYRTLAESGASEVFSDPARRGRLQPVFVADFTRTTRRIEPTAGTVIELAVDQGRITAGESSTPVSEVELEVKSGLAESMLDFAIALVRELPVLRVEPRSKAERGYSLAQQARQAPVKAVAPALDAKLSPEQALHAVVFSCVAQLQANEAGVMSGQDAEYLHQARVAMRRLRSALTVFRPGFPRTAFDEIVAELRWLDQALGPARDWDVFALSTLPRIARAFRQHPGLHALAEITQRLRTEANRAAMDALRASRYTVLLLKLLCLFYRKPWSAIPDEDAAAARSQPLEAFAHDVLSRRHRKVIKTGRRLVDADPQHESDHAELHRLRIEIKKLRYAAEFFSSLYDRKVKGYTGALAGLQELLGGLNDAATVERLCALLRRSDAEHPNDEAIGLVRGWAAASARTHLEQLPQAWKRFRDTDAFWE
jgi:inorganic triphosphatase YgiF